MELSLLSPRSRLARFSCAHVTKRGELHHGACQAQGHKPNYVGSELQLGEGPPACQDARFYRRRATNKSARTHLSSADVDGVGVDAVLEHVSLSEGHARNRWR
eukprot:1161635-Pelagomonas_calceolata.AAC.11